MITVSASLKSPISFFSPLKLTPVFPPTAASTAASRVVGTLRKRMPRLNVPAANPPRSVTTPPPMLTNADFLVPPCSNAFHTCSAVASVLCSSPQGMHITSASGSPIRLSTQAFTCSSVRMKTRLAFRRPTASRSASETLLVKIISCVAAIGNELSVFS